MQATRAVTHRRQVGSQPILGARAVGGDGQVRRRHGQRAVHIADVVVADAEVARARGVAGRNAVVAHVGGVGRACAGKRDPAHALTILQAARAVTHRRQVGSQPILGTRAVGGDGQVCWRDIGFESSWLDQVVVICISAVDAVIDRDGQICTHIL